MTVALNMLRELCGPGFLPTVVTFACRSPSNLKSLHAFFRAPLQFDSDESAVVFEGHWLDRPVPEVEPRVRQQVEDTFVGRQNGGRRFAILRNDK